MVIENLIGLIAQPYLDLSSKLALNANQKWKKIKPEKAMEAAVWLRSKVPSSPPALAENRQWRGDPPQQAVDERRQEQQQKQQQK